MLVASGLELASAKGHDDSLVPRGRRLRVTAMARVAGNEVLSERLFKDDKPRLQGFGVHTKRAEVGFDIDAKMTCKYAEKVAGL
jgi:hypothetical protein